MKRIFLPGIITVLFSFLAENVHSQCDTTNATSCVCQQSGSTDCDLLPDMIVARPPLTVSGTSGIIEYSQSGNGSNNGLLRISVSTPNIGFGPLEVRATDVYICGTDTFYGAAPATCPNSGLPPKTLINQRIYHKNGNVMTHYDRPAGTMTYHPLHGHMHVDDWGVYTLRTQTSDPDPLNWPIVATGSKLAFCLMDYGTCSFYNGHCVNSNNETLVNDSFPNFGLGGGDYGCSPVLQGISAGYTDIYYQHLDGMWINLPPTICNGLYYIVVQLDPYNYFWESNENNNVITVPYTLTLQNGTAPVVTASGPLTFCQGKNVTLTSASATNYLWSTGATTQAVNITSSGTYTVTIDAGSSCPATSVPVIVNVTPFIVQASATPNSICAGSSITINSDIISGTTMISSTVFTNNSQYVIPDNNPTGVSAPVTVSGINPATLSSGVVVSVKLNITHTYDADLVLTLISPSGNSVVLSNSRGGSNDNFTNTVFSMSAAGSIITGSAPFTGTYLPEGNFNVMTGNVNGTWYLKAVDAAAQDTGRIKNWTLTLKNLVPSTYTYNWVSDPAGFTATSGNGVHAPLSNTTYTVTVSDPNGCSTTASVTAVVNAIPVATFSGLNATYQVVDPVATLNGNPSGGTFSGTGIAVNKFNPAAAGVGGPYAITYNYTDGFGCTGNDVQSVSVISSTYNCKKPLGISVVNIKPAQAKIKWKSATAPQFKIRYKDVTSGTAYKYKTINGNVTSGVLYGLTPGHSYQVWARALCNGVNSPFSNMATFTTPLNKLDNAGNGNSDVNAHIFPNPNDGKFTLNFNSESNQSTALKISDMSGRIIFEKIINAVEGDNNYEIDLSAFENGIYLINLSQNGNYSYLKVIKQ